MYPLKDTMKLWQSSLSKKDGFHWILLDYRHVLLFFFLQIMIDKGM